MNDIIATLLFLMIYEQNEKFSVKCLHGLVVKEPFRLVSGKRNARMFFWPSRHGRLPNSHKNQIKMSMKDQYCMETVACELCGSASSEIYIKGAKELYNGMDEWFDVVRCLDCGFVFTNPRPTPETIGYFYPDSASYYQPKSTKIIAGIEKNSITRNSLRRSIIGNYFGYNFKKFPKILDFIPYLWLRKKIFLAHFPTFIEGGRLLDIGCSWGGYLLLMKQMGWDVYGVELNARAASFAEKDLGLSNVFCGFFDDLEYADDFFQVIHMGMVLEHLYKPVRILRKINRMLKEKGQLILSVPDITGFEAMVFKDKCYTLQVPQHLSHFSPATISRALQETGFKVDRIVHRKTKKDIWKSADYLENKGFSCFLRQGIVRSLVLGPFSTILALLGKSSRMSVYASKISTSGS